MSNPTTNTPPDATSRCTRSSICPLVLASADDIGHPLESRAHLSEAQNVLKTLEEALTIDLDDDFLDALHQIHVHSQKLGSTLSAAEMDGSNEKQKAYDEYFITERCVPLALSSAVGMVTACLHIAQELDRPHTLTQVEKSLLLQGLRAAISQWQSILGGTQS